MSFRVLAICSTFNRRGKSVRSVKQLLCQANESGICLTVMVVDNQSTDGTVEYLRTLGSNVHVLSTPRDMYWSESMQFGFKKIEKLDRFDAVLVFNDDVDLYESALIRLITECRDLQKTISPKLVLVASFVSGNGNGGVTYGGFKRHRVFRPKLLRVPPVERPILIDTCNMNCVLIGRECIEKFGFPDGPYRHSLADLDYGLKVTNSGGYVVLAPGVYGNCEKNDSCGTWRDLDKPLTERWRMISQPKGRPLFERWRFLRRNFGVLGLPFVVTPLLQIVTDEIRRCCGNIRRLANK